MILLPTQLQALTLMVLLGWGYGVVYGLFNRLFYRWRKRAILFILEVLFHVVFMFGLYTGLFRINYGVMNLYLWLGFFVGLYGYYRYYSQIFFRLYEAVMRFLNLILKPVKIAYLKILAIIRSVQKKRRRMKGVRKQRRKEKKEKAKKIQ